MRLTFLGTKGYIKPRSKRYEMHTCMMVSHGGKRVLIDYGESWRKKIFKLRPHQIVLTHAHPDHAYGLDEGAPCTVWAPKQTWRLINDFPIEKRQRKIIPLRKPIKIAGITFEAFDVIHSLKCPAVGYRITAGKVSVFYVPDIIWIHRQAKALKGIRLYIGDGATVQRNMVRKDKETGKILAMPMFGSNSTGAKKRAFRK